MSGFSTEQPELCIFNTSSDFFKCNSLFNSKSTISEVANLFGNFRAPDFHKYYLVRPKYQSLYANRLNGVFASAKSAFSSPLHVQTDLSFGKFPADIGVSIGKGVTCMC